MLSDVNDRNGYLNKTFSCSCGRVHKTSLKSINLEKGAARAGRADHIGRISLPPDRRRPEHLVCGRRLHRAGA